MPKHPEFDEFVRTYSETASRYGIFWSITCDRVGKIAQSERWDLCDIAGVPKPPAYKLKDLGFDKKILALLNEERKKQSLKAIENMAISRGWQNLLKALIIRDIFERKNGPLNAYANIARPVRVLATFCHEKEPWNITKEDVVGTIGITSKVDKNLKLQRLVEAVVMLMDANNISKNCPLMSKQQNRPNPSAPNTKQIRATLDQRKNAERLPGEKEFWELLRIVLEEQPKSFVDAIRFVAAEMHILMGIRAGETAVIPHDPLFERVHTTDSGLAPASRGGLNHTLYLRHFSEKQSTKTNDSIVFAETATSVIDMFEDELRSLVRNVENLTRPLRRTLTKQLSSGRIFPDFDPEQFVLATEIYPYLTGNPFVYEDSKSDFLISKYQSSFDRRILEEIKIRQKRIGSGHHSKSNLSQAVRVYFARKENSWIPLSGERSFALKGVIIGELEEAVRSNLITKISDTDPFPLEGGRELSVTDCLFLMPKRALSDGRNNGICDVTRYAFVGRLQYSDLATAFGASARLQQSLFGRYGSKSARRFRLKSHTLRHMHNNELFAAGVSDTIITHRFGRKSVAQSYEYDHRTLDQALSDVDLPEGTEALLVGSARDVMKLISNGIGAGPIVNEFRRIQDREGDEAAIVYLATEADGMQITPYGLCLNSFVVEPCPKHLECFDGCCHLMRTGNTAETVQLKKLKSRYELLIKSIDLHPGSKPAKEKAHKQAIERLDALDRMLQASPGQQVFEDGPDLSKTGKLGGLI